MGSCYTLYSQSPILYELEIVDSTTYNGQQIYIFNDQSWEYAVNYNVEYNYEAVRDSLGCVLIDKDVLMKSNWNKNKTFSRQYNLALLKDSILINVSGYNPPAGKISSTFKFRWGQWHKGVDYGVPVGTPIKSSFDGVIRYSQLNYGGYGQLIIVRHYNGLETYYAHLSSRMVKSGDKVKGGDIIGYSGNTGHTTGPHLHYEIRILDNVFDPGIISRTDSTLCINSSLFVTTKNQTGKDVFINKIYKIKSVDDNIGNHITKEVTINRSRRRNTSSNFH